MSFTGPNAGDPNRIVIRNEDLDEDIPAAPAGIRGGEMGTSSYGPSNALPGLGPQPQPMPIAFANTGNFLARLGANSVVSGLAAGAIGGIVGFFIAENLKNPQQMTANSQIGLQAQSGIWTLLFGLGLGALLMAWNGITSQSAQKALRDGAIGAAIGAGAGFIGGFFAQWLYSTLVKNALSASSLDSFKNQILLARTIGWALLGALVGTGLGANGGLKKIVNGLIGGTIGGAVGGLIFQLIDNSSTSNDGFLVRLIGLLITGVGIGLAVGLVEHVRRDSWIQITGGPMSGKEFILYNAQTKVGRDYRCDIVMAKDLAVAPIHATFLRDNAGQVSVQPTAGVMITVNGVPSGGSRLRDRDVIGIGRSMLSYQERAAAGISRI